MIWACNFFSTPFDASAVDFLEAMDVPVHKIASFELVDLPLLRKIAATQKPIIMSTSMSTLDEISEALDTLRLAESGPVLLLKCTSAYPATADEMNLRTIHDMAAHFQTHVGLSEHTIGSMVAEAAVALGACVVEKHEQHPLPDTDLDPGCPAWPVGAGRACVVGWSGIGRLSTGTESSW
jgi:pseudaminic acid synthase